MAFYNLDQFSILGDCVYAVGWAQNFLPSITYKGVLLPLAVRRQCREDVASAFNDPSAAEWGFAVTALLPERPIERSQLVFEIGPGMTLTDPGCHLRPLEDSRSAEMTATFVDEANIRGGSLLEIGSRARSGTTYRSWFSEAIDYTGFDITEGPNVDVVGDAHYLSRYIDRQFDYIFSISVFEHLLMPWKVAIEINRVLKLGGLAYIASHAGFPLHDQPWDFWRYSTDAWKGIFNQFSGFKVRNACYRYPAHIVPRVTSDPGFEGISLQPTFLTSSCVVEKIGDATVEWSADPAAVINLNYSYQS